MPGYGNALFIQGGQRRVKINESLIYVGSADSRRTTQSRFIDIDLTHS